MAELQDVVFYYFWRKMIDFNSIGCWSAVRSAQNRPIARWLAVDPSRPAIVRAILLQSAPLVVARAKKQLLWEINLLLLPGRGVHPPTTKNINFQKNIFSPKFFFYFFSKKVETPKNFFRKKCVAPKIFFSNFFFIFSQKSWDSKKFYSENFF